MKFLEMVLREGRNVNVFRFESLSRRIKL